MFSDLNVAAARYCHLETIGLFLYLDLAIEGVDGGADSTNAANGRRVDELKAALYKKLL